MGYGTHCISQGYKLYFSLSLSLSLSLPFLINTTLSASFRHIGQKPEDRIHSLG